MILRVAKKILEPIVAVDLKLKQPLMIALACCLAGVGCTRPNSPNKNLRIQFPKALDSKNNSDPKMQSRTFTNSGSSINYENLCFVVNVRGENIPSKSSANCQIEKGLVAGSVPPGASVSMMISSSSKVTVEIFGLLRKSATEPCPEVSDRDWTWPISRTYFLDAKKDVALTTAETNVEFNLTLPAITNNVAIQNSWPHSCLASSTPSNHRSGRVTAGAALLVGGSHRLYVREANVADLNSLKGNRFVIKHWRPK